MEIKKTVRTKAHRVDYRSDGIAEHIENQLCKKLLVDVANDIKLGSNYEVDTQVSWEIKSREIVECKAVAVVRGDEY